MRSSPGLTAAVVAAGLSIASGIVTAGQLPGPTFRSGISGVSLNVIVKDNRGRPIRDLVGADFQVFDQGRAVRIDDFRVGEEPVSIALLIDTSGSMRIGTRLSSAERACEMLLAQLRPGDEAALLTFDRTLTDVVPFSTDLANVRRGFERVDPYGSTSLHDAVVAAARRSAARPSPRRAVIAITDGFDNSSQLSAAGASSAASLIDVPVYVLAVANTAAPVDPGTIALEPVEGGGVARLDELTAETGGASFAAETSADMSRSVRQILTDLREAYVLAFTPHDTPGWHQLTVRVARKNARVRTRAGFWVGSSTPAVR